MAWNEDGNGKDPWKRDGDQPNDLDQIVQDWQKKIGRILGGGSGGGGSAGGTVMAALLVAAWILTGFYRVDAAERGVEQRFGKYMEPVTLPGLRWHWPFPVESVDIINIEEVNDFNYSTEMLTADLWYVYIDVAVQYRRTDPVAYSFLVEDPEMTLQDVTESALRGVVGTSTLESLIGERREEIPARTIIELQETLDGYGAGLTVTSININKVNYPTAVEDAVADTLRATNDGDRYKFEAEKYANDIVPKARGQREVVLQDAEAYRERVIAEAEGDASRFEALLTEYRKAPRVTRDRLYIEAVEQVYSESAKVLIDTEGSGNLLYLPLNEIMRRSGIDIPSVDPSGTSMTPGRSQDESDESSARERRTRQ
ncbi:MAG TPA: FtsH protease activity modulator HflK [Woeseiaceae bacterium]|jgi:membrane protease subunit HflK|nr:FtsH protease activity modulator HflK [Woeseiaceae bacterium]